MILAFLLSFVSSNSESDVAVEHLAFPSESGVAIPLVLMTISLLALLGFFGFHLHRIMKEMTSVSPIFDMAETESKMDFTIAERGSA